MAKKRPQVALVYDFDGTLSPGNMQEFGFIQATGKTKEEFWDKTGSLPWARMPTAFSPICI